MEELARFSPEIGVPSRPTQFDYDSEFSSISTSSASDTDSDIPYSADLESRVPLFCMQPPKIPAGRFKWECPGCDYVIDLLRLTAENTKGLSPELDAYLREKSWQYINEDKMKWSLHKMISNHYKSHLHQNGVHVIVDRSKVCSLQIIHLRCSNSSYNI